MRFFSENEFHSAVRAVISKEFKAARNGVQPKILFHVADIAVFLAVCVGIDGFIERFHHIEPQRYRRFVALRHLPAHALHINFADLVDRPVAALCHDDAERYEHGDADDRSHEDKRKHR